MSTQDTLIRACMAGAILALAAVFAVTIAVQTGVFLLAQCYSQWAFVCSTLWGLTY